MREPTQEELDRLFDAAHSWLGTPFCANSATKGAGVCCHMLVAEVYREAGWIGRFPDPVGPPVWSRAQRHSLMEEWLDGPNAAEWFERTNIDFLQPGDLLGFRVGTCIHHLGILLQGNFVAHSSYPAGASIAPVNALPSAWASRLAAAWRPKLK